MPQEHQQKDNTGVLFREQNRKSDKHPSHTGKALIGGVWYKIACWPKQGKDGTTYLTPRFTPMDDQKAPTSRAPAAASYQEDIPF